MTERNIIGHKAYTENFSNGATIVVTNLDILPDVNITHTQEHEAWHVVAADGDIVTATDIPGEGYLGLTITEGYSPIAAAGPHAMGCSGTDFDMSKPGAHQAVSAARSKLMGMREEMQEVASDIKHKRTIGKKDAKTGIKKAQDRKLGIVPVEIQITDAEGHTYIETSITDRGVIKLDNFKLKLINKNPENGQELPETV